MKIEFDSVENGSVIGGGYGQDPEGGGIWVLGAGLQVLPMDGRQLLPQRRPPRRFLHFPAPPELRQPPHGRQAPLRCCFRRRLYSWPAPHTLYRLRRYLLTTYYLLHHTTPISFFFLS